MKNLILLFLGLLLAIIGQAQIATKTVNLTTAGTLSTVLTANELGSTVGLTLTGTIDARDFKTMRDSMPLLANIDLSGVNIVVYEGTKGTSRNDTTYPSNTIPNNALQNNNGNPFLADGLISVKLPLSVSSIGDFAFSSCNSLTSIDISSTVINIGKYAFAWSSGLINVDNNNPNYSSIDGILFNKAQTELRQCPVSKYGSYSIPSTVTSIGESAFSMCPLTSINIPSTVDSIGQEAFWGCGAIKSITIPSSVKYIGALAFYETQLSSISIPSSVNYIGASAFVYCPLTSITVEWMNPLDISSSYEVFKFLDKSTCTLYVPSGSKTAYQEANQWQDFLHIIDGTGLWLSNTSKNIPSNAGYSQLTTINGNTSWTVTSNQPWLTVSPTQGNGNGVLNISYDENATGAQRVAKVTITDANNIVHEVNINQAFEIGVDDLVVKRTSKTPVVNGEIDANDPWGDEWLTMNKQNLNNTTNDMQSRFQIFAGEDAFYIVIVVDDATPSNDLSIENSYERDCSNLLFSMDTSAFDNGGAYKEGTWMLRTQREHPDGLFIDGISHANTWDIGSLISHSGFSAFSKSTPTSYVQEFILPFEALDGDFQWDQEYFRFEVYTSDNTTGSPGGRTQMKFWNDNSDNQWNDTRTFGVARLEPSNNPVAKAGKDQYAEKGVVVTLDGTASYDPNGLALSYLWTAPVGVQLSSATDVKPTFTISDNIIAAQLVFKLVVNNGERNSIADEVVVFVRQEQEATIEATPGNLSALLSAKKEYLTALTLTGTIDARDFKTMRDSMPLLAEIDLSGATIVAYNGAEGTINDTGNYNYPASEVPPQAFTNSNWEGKPTLVSVVFPTTITSIGYEAFYNCNKLTSINIPSGVTYLGDLAFCICNNLESVSLPNTLTEISYDAFSHCSKLKDVNIPASVTLIRERAFINCAGPFIVDASNPNYSSLNGVLFDKNKITLLQCPNTQTGVYAVPPSVKTIGNDAFSNCYNLSSVIIPEVVTTIGYFAFINCINLTSVNIPASVTIIRDYAFQNCAGPFIVNSSNPNYSSLNGVLFDKNQTTLIQCPTSLVGEYTVPSSIKTIGNRAFIYCNLTTVNIPEGVTTIGGEAFYNCRNLTSVSIPSTVSNIGNFAFAYTYTLTSITAYSSAPVNLSNSNRVFDGINKTTCTLYVPYGSKAAYQNAVQWKDFQNIVEMPGLLPSKTSLSFTPSAATTKIFIASNVGWSAESSANWLSINPASSLGSDSLSISVTQNAGDVRTATITVHPTGLANQTITVIQNGVVQVTAGNLATILGDQLATTTSLTLVGTIDARDFKTMRDAMPLLAEIDLSGATIVAYNGAEGTINGTGNYNYPANEVPQQAFRNSNGEGKATLASFVFPTTTTSIGNYAFYNCSNLESVFLPNTLTGISYGVFEYCAKLKNINIPASVTVIEESTFSNCAGPFIVDASNPNYSSLNGVLFNKEQTKLLQSPTSITGIFVIPSTVKTIGFNSFWECADLTSIIIPSSVNTIGIQSFWGCSGLTSIDIPTSVTSIGGYTFSLCSGLSTFDFPSSITSIGDYTFQSCTGLKTVHIPSSIKSIGNRAFSGCSGLMSIYVNSGIPINLTNSTDVFNNVNKSTCTLYVPYGSKAAYQNAVQWKDFQNIVEMQGLFPSTTSLSFTPSAATTKIFIGSSVGWSAESSANWLSIDPASSQGSDSLSITVTQNANDVRTATITIHPTGLADQTITVTQYGVVQVTAGNLAALLGDQLSTITSLTLVGTIDARDFKTMRDSMPYLAEIDLSGVTIVAYNGAEGTINGTGNYSYPANEVPQYAFVNSNWTGKTTLVSVVFPTTITSIGSYSFYDCSNLESVSLPNTLSEISYDAFSYCTKLKDINIPASVTLIRERAFINCAGPFIVDASNPNYSSLNGVLFDKKQISLLQCPNTQTGVYAVPFSVKTIGNYAFNNCDNLTAVNIPEGVTTIGNYVFDNCNNLTTVNMAEGITTIGNNAFISCIKLASVNIPASVAVIGDYAFQDCAGPFIVNSSNPNYSSLNGVLFDKNQTILIQCPASLIGEYTVPSSVKTIGNYAFYDCDNITIVNIPEGVTSIGNYAFYSCSKLTSVSLPATVSNIGNYAFAYTYALTSITANSSSPVNLSNSNRVFDGVNKTTCTLYVPYGSKAAYQNAVQWKDFTTIVEATSGFGVGVKTILLPSIESDSTISVIANVPWSVSTDQAWLTVTPQSGTNDGSFTISATANTGYDRKATVTLSSSGYSDQLIFVSQESGLPNLILSDSMNASAPLVCDNYIQIITNSHEQFFRFTPEQSGNYTFYSESTSDPIAAVFNSMGNNIGGDDDLGTDMNFIFMCNLIAGEKYYFRLRNYSGNNRVIDLYITGGNLVCNQDGIPEDQQISSKTLRENTDTCFNAYENITVAGDGTSVIFESGSSTTLIAGNSIRFLPGFHAQSGSWMDAHITTTNLFCNAANESMLAAQVEEKSIAVAETEAAVVMPVEKSIKVYPNPNNGQFFLEVSNFETRATVSIYNMLGSKVYESEMTNDADQKINLLGIKKGIYFVKVTDREEQFTKKIIVR